MSRWRLVRPASSPNPASVILLFPTSTVVSLPAFAMCLAAASVQGTSGASNTSVVNSGIPAKGASPASVTATCPRVSFRSPGALLRPANRVSVAHAP